MGGFKTLIGQSPGGGAKDVKFVTEETFCFFVNP